MDFTQIKAHLDSLQGGAIDKLRTLKDSQSLPWFARQVEQILARTYEKQFPELMGANGDVIPISSDVDPGAETFTFYLYEPSGLAKFFTHYAHEELPEVTIQGAKITKSTEPFGNKWHWTVQDIRRARFAGQNLQTRLVDAARRAHDQLTHQTLLWGNDSLGLDGFVNHPNITVGVAADPGGGTEFANKTVDQIVEDFATVIDGVNEITCTVESVTDVLLPDTVYNYLRRTRVNPGGDSMDKILDHIRGIWPDVRIRPIVDLRASKSRGNLATDSLIAYAFDASKCDYVRPLDFSTLPVQVEGFKFVTYAESMSGGVRCPVPLSIYRLDGIGAS